MSNFYYTDNVKNTPVDTIKWLNNADHMQHLLVDLKKHNYVDVHHWARMHCSKYFVILYTEVATADGMRRICCFESEDDMTLFALRWCA